MSTSMQLLEEYVRVLRVVSPYLGVSVFSPEELGERIAFLDKMLRAGVNEYDIVRIFDRAEREFTAGDGVIRVLTQKQDGSRGFDDRHRWSYVSAAIMEKKIMGVRS
jgi:hypothetical protein